VALSPALRAKFAQASLDRNKTKATAASANAPVRRSPARASSVALEAVSRRNEATAKPAAAAASSASTIHHISPPRGNVRDLLRPREPPNPLLERVLAEAISSRRCSSRRASRSGKELCPTRRLRGLVGMDGNVAENARGAGYEDFHDCSSRLVAPNRRDRGAACDSAQSAHVVRPVLVRPTCAPARVRDRDAGTHDG
jgi:hypothetical protein